MREVALIGAAVILNLAYIFSTLDHACGGYRLCGAFPLHLAALGESFSASRCSGTEPDTVTLIGAAIVVATGIFTFHRERKLAMEAAAGPVAAPAESGFC